MSPYGEVNIGVVHPVGSYFELGEEYELVFMKAFGEKADLDFTKA